MLWIFSIMYCSSGDLLTSAPLNIWMCTYLNSNIVICLQNCITNKGKQKAANSASQSLFFAIWFLTCYWYVYKFICVRAQHSFIVNMSSFVDLKKAVVICEGGSSRDENVVKVKMENIHRLVSASHGWAFSSLGLPAHWQKVNITSAKSWYPQPFLFGSSFHFLYL